MKPLPSHTQASIDAYVSKGYPPGDFLRAVLINDLKLACAHADSHNSAALADIVGWLWNNVPSICWGSKEKYDRWLEYSQNERDNILNLSQRVSK